MHNEPDLPHKGKRVVCSIAQKPFTDRNGNIFCTLSPLLFDDRSRVQQGAFPENGLIWWLVTEKDKSYANPGRLVSVVVEPSREAGSSGKDWYQVVYHTIAEVNEYGFTEVVELPDAVASDPRYLLSQKISLLHPPSKRVYAAWQQHLYGPLATTIVEHSPSGQVWVRFESTSQPGGKISVQRLPLTKSSVLQQAVECPLDIKVSLNDRPIYSEDGQVTIFRYLLAPTAELDKDLAAAEKISVETDTQLLTRAVKHLKLLGRERRKQLRTLLDELEEQLAATTVGDSEHAKAAAERVRHALSMNELYAKELVDSLVESDLIRPLVDKAILQKVSIRVAEIEREAMEQAKATLEKLNELREEEKIVAASLQYQKEATEKEIEAQRQRFEQEVSAKRERLAKAHQELSQAQEHLEKHLRPVTQRLETARDEIINQFLAIAPLIEQLSKDGSPAVGRQPAGSSKISPDEQQFRVREPIRDWTTFVDKRLWPILAEWQPRVTRKQAELFHVCMMACRCSIVPDPSWGSAYANAVGGQFVLRHVEPDWLTFSKAWTSELEQAWREACANRDGLYFVMFEGVDRSPTSAWAQPWLSIVAGFCDRLPVADGVSWPDNLRILLSFDRGPASFQPAVAYRFAAGAVSPKPLGQDASPPQSSVNGYVPVETWREWANPSVKSEISSPDWADSDIDKDCTAWRRSIRADLCRIVQILAIRNEAVETAEHIARKIRLEWPGKYVETCHERD